MSGKDFLYYSSLQKKCEEKILLTYKVYVRLLGLINLCAFNSNEAANRLTEYGEFLFGYYDKDKIVFYDHSSKLGNTTTVNGEYKSTDEMIDEMLEKMFYGKDYNCFANVHTHPSYTASGMAFSTPDIEQYRLDKRSFDHSSKKIRTFGCMMSLDPRQFYNDAIAFVSCNDNDTISYYPNISVIIDDKILPLKEVPLTLFIDEEGKPYLDPIKNHVEKITILRNIMQ